MMYQVPFRAMGCRMLALLDAHDAQAQGYLLDVPSWFATWEHVLSRFRCDSELSQLNARSGQISSVSPILWQVLCAAQQAAQQSDGLVSPMLLAALEEAGYTHDFMHHAPMQTIAINNCLEREWASVVHTSQPLTSTSHLPIPEWHMLELHTREQTVYVPLGARLDVGGIAKGWAATQAAGQLCAYGAAMIDAGGDIAVSGPQLNGEAWPIGVEHPLEPNVQLALLLISQGGVATSGRDYRRWQHKGHMQHHIIDPRTGRPAETDVMSATVIAQSLIDAEVAAKVVVILGSTAGLAWIEERPWLAALLTLENGQILQSSRLPRYLWQESPSA